MAEGYNEGLLLKAWEKVQGFFKDMVGKEAINCREAYAAYIKNMMDRYGKVKTVIYRNEPRDIYAFYECLDIKYADIVIHTDSILNLQSLRNKTLITGIGGTGKSMLFRYLFLKAIEETNRIPVMVELRKLNVSENISLYDSVYKVLCDNGFTLEQKYFEYSMRGGAYILFFDGYDEVRSDKTSIVSEQIQSLASKYNDNWYFVSSRPDSSGAFIGWDGFCEARTRGMSKRQALSLVKKIEFDDDTKRVFYDELENGLYEKYRSFASNPLLLTIMLLTFQKHASIPDRLIDFYDEAFVTLFNVHDATKDAFVRDIRSKLACEDFKTIFAYICFKSYFRGELDFSESRLIEYVVEAQRKFSGISFEVNAYIEDMTKSVCMLIKDGITYRFTHRSFQEYFAAWYTCKLLDRDQEQLLSQWIEEPSNAMVSSYFLMLFNMQPEKVNRLIFKPAIDRIVELYQAYGFSVQFLESIYDSASFRSYNREGKIRTLIGARAKDRYLNNILYLCCDLNGFRRKGGRVANNADREAICDKLRSKGMISKDTQISFSRLKDELTEKEFLDLFGWIIPQIEFAAETIQRYDAQQTDRKSVSQIIDQL